MSNVKESDILIETSLLKAMSIRYNYDTFADFIDFKRLLPNTLILLTDYEKYYKAFDHDEIDWGTFVTEFSQRWHRKDLDNDDIVYYRDTVIPMIQSKPQQEVEQVLVSLLDRQYTDKLYSAIDGGIDANEVEELVDEYRLNKSKYSIEVDEEAFSIDRVDFSILDKENGVPWFLPSLQQGLGSLVQGQFVVVAADYGTGKSAFVINQSVEAFKQLHRTGGTNPVLYFNSEGTSADVFTRFLSCLYSKHVTGGFEEVLKRIEEVREKFVATFNANNFLVFQIQQGDTSKIRQKVAQYKPSMVIIDIADTLAKEEDVQSLKKLFDGLRLLSAQSCPIIATTQSGNTEYKYFDKEENQMVTKTRKWLTDKDLYGSKAGKGGAADTIITIGKDDDMPNVRYVHTPKKKRGQIVSTTCELVEKFSLYREVI